MNHSPDKESIIEDLAALFDVDDMSELDACDFKDNADKIFDLYKRAKEYLDNPTHEEWHPGQSL